MNETASGREAAVRHARTIEARQVDLLYEQSPFSLAASVIIGLLLAAGLWMVVSKTVLVLWVLGNAGLSAARYGLLQQFRRSTHQAADRFLWRRRFLVGVTLSGLLWGGAGTFFFVPQSYIHQILLAFVLAGMSGGAATTLSPVRGAFLFFLLPALVPYTVRVIFFGGEIHVIMGSMLTLFVAMMWMIAQQLNATVEQSLCLGLENLDLVRDLSQARDLQETAHRALATEMQERQEAQKALQASHCELEQRVRERTRKLAQLSERLETEKELFRVTLANIGDGVITTDRIKRIVYLNPSAEKLTGWKSFEVQGKPLATIFQIKHQDVEQWEEGSIRTTLAEEVRQGTDDHLVLTDRAGSKREIRQSATPILDQRGETMGTVLTFRDISEESKLARRLSYQATHDSLTGLVNRREFDRRLARVLRSSEANDRHALIFMDLDQFKVVNDTCGHVAGDELLRQIAALMRSHIRTRDTFARLGGDEFGVLLEHCAVEEATRVARTLRELVQDYRFGWQEKSFVVGVSIGLVEITGGWESSASVLRAADSACYVAKDRGRNRIYVYKPDDQLVARRLGEMQWMPRIRLALADGRLRLFRQPIVPTHPATDGCEFCEVLVRLLDDQGTIVPPGAFLPAAERYGQISVIDRWVLGKVVDALSARGAAQRKTILSVNLSGQSISDQDILDFIVERVKRSHITPLSLCFEITETAAISDFPNALSFITRLRELGCRFALDDFGSGLSSFGYLKALPIDYLKIDGRFVKDIASDRVDEAMVEAIHHVGKVMGLYTIAEWVEDADTLEKLAAMRVDYAQGFYLAPPKPM